MAGTLKKKELFQEDKFMFITHTQIFSDHIISHFIVNPTLDMEFNSHCKLVIVS